MPTAFGLLPPETQDTTAGRASDITSPQAQNFTPTEANLTPPSQAQPTLNPELDETQIKIAKLLADNQREIDQNTPPTVRHGQGLWGY